MESRMEAFAGIPVNRKIHKRAQDHLTLHERDGVVWGSFEGLDALSWLRHGFSTRVGGLSEGEIGSMNLSFTHEDDPKRVQENFRRIARAIGFDPARVVRTYQSHSANVRVVRREDARCGSLGEHTFMDADGLVTDEPGLVLSCFGSDCVMLLAADPKRKVVGCAHSGWRGTVGDIGGNLIRTMQETFGCRGEDILTAIGPSICRDCYEVGAEVIEEFRKMYPQSAYDRLFDRKENGKYQLDLWEACALNFERAGVLREQIYMTDLCTRCNPTLLFSARGQKGRQTNLAAFITILE